MWEGSSTYLWGRRGEGGGRERRERRKWGEKGKEEERAEGKKGGRKRDREDKVLNYGWKSLLLKQEEMHAAFNCGMNVL